MAQGSDADICHLLVVLPTWVGDVVMATPTLRSLRRALPRAHIAGLVRRGAAAVLDPCDLLDDLLVVRREASIRQTAKVVAAEDFDTALLLPNSFRSAATVRLAGVRRRIGYARDGRGWLLTDRLTPRREGGRYTPVSAIDYYLALAGRIGGTTDDRVLGLQTHPVDDAEAEKLLRRAAPGEGPLVLLNPGGSYGAAKLWPARRFAAVADALITERRARVVVNGSPAERRVLDAVHGAAHNALVDLPAQGGDLRLLKSIVKRCDLMITNDTGPRHFAAALGVPVVTVFGPTDPRWAAIDCERERIIREDVFCGPCQLKVCPIDHRCMTRVTVPHVLEAALAMLDDGPGQRSHDRGRC